MPTQKLTAEILAAAIEGFESQKRRIDDQIAGLRAMLPDGRPEPAAMAEVPKGKRRKMSAAARKRISDAQRKRWAESKGISQPAASPKSPQRKRKLSAAGRRAIRAATKKRWAAFHAAKDGSAKKTARKVAKKALTKVAKKTAMKQPHKKAASTPPASVAAQ